MGDIKVLRNYIYLLCLWKVNMPQGYAISNFALEQYCLKRYKDRLHHLQFPKVRQEITKNLQQSRDSALTLEQIAKYNKFYFLNPDEIQVREHSGLIYICRDNGKRKLLAVFSIG